MPTIEIQRELIRLGFLPEGEDDDDYGRVTSKAVAAWQQTRWLVTDGVFGGTSKGIMFPPAGSIHGIDYSWARPDPKMLASRGVNLAGRYLWQSAGNKGISRAEYDALRAENIDVFFFYETSAEDSMAGGFDVGVRHAKAAQGFLDALGLPNAAVHFNVDHDASAAQIPAILEGMRGAASIVGKRRAGIYGEYDVVKAVLDDGYTYACQTYAWSGSEWDSRATTQQWSNGQWGGSVDFTRAMKPDFGQAI